MAISSTQLIHIFLCLFQSKLEISFQIAFRILNLIIVKIVKFGYSRDGKEAMNR